MVSLVFSDRFADHIMPPGHPERVARGHVMQAVVEKWREQGVVVLEPRPATRDELARVHAPAYLERVASTSGRASVLDPDTYTSPDSVDVAALAAGAAMVAVDAALAGVPSALALVRPPGHHAESSRAMGFCLYNNVALGAAHALARGLTRVAVVDYDVHHGNGTQWAFYRDSRVLVVSAHEYPFYPGTGSAGEAGVGEGEGYTVNIPLDAGATDGDYAMVFERIVRPVLDAERPELMLVSAGFDAHQRDPLANMQLSVAGLNGLARSLHAAAASNRCPIVFVTEGGYHLKVLGACLDGLIAILAGSPSVLSPVTAPTDPLHVDEAPLVEEPTPEPTYRGPAAVELVRAAQARYWPGL